MHPTIERWVLAINTQDIDMLESLGAEDHVFFVEGETPTVGRHRIRASWEGYFELCPNYMVYIDEYFENVDAFYLIGHTTGSHVPRHIEVRPSSVIWRCVLNEGSVREWSIYEATRENRAKYNVLSETD